MQPLPFLTPLSVFSLGRFWAWRGGLGETESVEKSLAISACVPKRFPSDFRGQHGPKLAPKSTPRGLQEPLGAEVALQAAFFCLFQAFWASPGLNFQAFLCVGSYLLLSLLVCLLHLPNSRRRSGTLCFHLFLSIFMLLLFAPACHRNRLENVAKISACV